MKGISWTVAENVCLFAPIADLKRVHSKSPQDAISGIAPKPTFETVHVTVVKY